MASGSVEVEVEVEAAATLVAARTTEDDEWRRAGYRSRDEWLARTTGTTTGKARQNLDASVKLDELPSTAARAGQGELSDEQATAVIDGIWHWTDPPDDSG